MKTRSKLSASFINLFALAFSLIGLIGLNYGWADRVDDLIVLLKDQDSYIRMKTAVVLGEIAEKSVDKKFLQPAIEPLITALKDEDVTVRANAAVALGDIGDAKAVEPLIAALKDQNSHVSMNVALGLAKIGDKRGIETAVIEMINKLRAQDGYIRKLGALALGKMAEKVDDKKLLQPAVEPLIEALTLKDPDAILRRYTAYALWKIGDAKAIEALILALKDPDYQIRLNAVEALGEIAEKVDDKRIIQPVSEALISTLKDRNQYSEVAVYWLGRIGKMGKIGDVRTLEPLISDLKAQDVIIRAQTVRWLGQIGDAKAVKPLVEALKDQAQEVRISAAVALGEIGDVKAVEPLIEALKDQDVYVRIWTSRALEKIAEKTTDKKLFYPAVAPLSDALKDQNLTVRIAVVALGKIGDAKAAAALMNALKDQDGYLRISAIKALEQIRDKCDIDAIKEKISEELWREVILPRVKKKYENEGEEWLTYVNTEQHFRFQYPTTWNLTTLPGMSTSGGQIGKPILVSLNNAGMDNFWVDELHMLSYRKGIGGSWGYDAQKVADRFPPGCVYLDVRRRRFDLPGNIIQSEKYTETEALDVTSLIDKIPETPAEDIRLVMWRLSLRKWRSWWSINIYLREPISERNRQMVDRILRSFQLDAIPAGDELWALGEAIKHLPPEADPEVFQRFISTGSVGLHSVRTEKRGDEVIVTFAKGTKELKKTWQFQVTATGEVVRMED